MASKSAKRWNGSDRPNSMSQMKPCSECGANGHALTIRISYKLDPTNWKPEKRLLCKKCRDALGWAIESGERTETIIDQPGLRRNRGA